MKQGFAIIAATLGLCACGNEAAETVDPYADLAEGTVLVRFEANPEISEDQCNPNVHYAMRTSEGSILINANYEIVDQSLNGSGFGIVDRENTGIATSTSEFNMFDAYPVPCSELDVRVQDLTCRTEDDEDTNVCPTPKFEGTEMFGTFSG